MKKVSVLVLLLLLSLTLAGCGLFRTVDDIIDDDDDTTIIDDDDDDLIDDDPVSYPDRIRIPVDIGCSGTGNYIIINGECILIEDLLSGNFTINKDHVIFSSSGVVQKLDELVADLSGSTGLAVIPKEVYNNQTLLKSNERTHLMKLSSASILTDDPSTDNLIVKLTEDGFFEIVSFSDSKGNTVNITSNPLALEIYGGFTIIFFDVEFNNEQNDTRTLEQKLFTSLYAGGIYIIHNETGKVFATSEVVYEDYTEEYTETYFHTITVMVTLNEPVYYEVTQNQLDEFGEPLLDEFGDILTEVILVAILDDEGNPVIYTEGPIVTEIEYIPIVEYYDVLVYDTDGNVVLDAEGEPVYETIEEPVLDADGNPTFLEQVVAVFDEDGNIVYEANFEVEFVITEHIEIIEHHFHATVQPTVLSVLANRFVDRILEEYYNWNYSRPNNYLINNWQIAESYKAIYYMDVKEVPNGAEFIVFRLTYDHVTTELVLEEYLNASKADVFACELLIDPLTENIICNPFASNLIVYSETKGLMTLPNTASYNYIVFPNGQLYFRSWVEPFVEDLGYYTQYLYSINEEGVIEGKPIELGARQRYCQSAECHWSFPVVFKDSAGEIVPNFQEYVSGVFKLGDALIDEAVPVLKEALNINPETTVCNREGLCYYTVKTTINLEDTLIGDFIYSFHLNSGDSPPYAEAIFNLDSPGKSGDDVWINYREKTIFNDLTCQDSEFGCVNDIRLIDPSFGEHSLLMSSRFLIEFGDPFVEHIEIKTNHQAVYEYSTYLRKDPCGDDLTSCWESIPFYIYGLDGTLIFSGHQDMTILNGESFPYYINYTMTQDTLITEYDTVCDAIEGCTVWYSAYEGIAFTIEYPMGVAMYETIQFVETDIDAVYEIFDTRTNCLELNGCSQKITYYLMDEDEVLYKFIDYPLIQYGSKLPHVVTLTLDDVIIVNHTEWHNELVICEELVCYQNVQITHDINSEVTITYIIESVEFHQGETLISLIRIMESATPSEMSMIFRCQDLEGCFYETNDVIIHDMYGEIIENAPTHQLRFLARFEYGEIIPVHETFTGVFEFTETKYIFDRLQSGHALGDEMTILEENIYLMRGSYWAIDEGHVILKYDPILDQYKTFITNFPRLNEIVKLGDGYVGINHDRTAIFYVEYNPAKSTDGYLHYDLINLTEGKQINVVNSLVVDYNGSIYFKAINSFIQSITGTISTEGTVTIDTTYTEREVVRLRPIN